MVPNSSTDKLASLNEAMEKARKRLNSYAATRTIGMGGAYINTPIYI